MLLYSTIAEQVKKLEKVSMEDKMPSNYYSAYEELDDFRPQKRIKLDIEAASSKEKDFSLDHKEHVRSDATLVKTKLHKSSHLMLARLRSAWSMQSYGRN